MKTETQTENKAAHTPTDAQKAKFSALLHSHVSSQNNLRFRSLLEDHGVSGPTNYDWNFGDPLFMGDPIAGRATERETRAIGAMRLKATGNAA